MILQVDHREHMTEDSYEDVIDRIMAVTGSVEEGYDTVSDATEDLEDFERTFKAREGSSGFMRFLVLDHGEWLTRFYDTPTKATLIVLGNPLIAISMLGPDVGAGLNVPTRIYIYEGLDGRTHVVYDLPSTQMGNLTDETRAAAGKLDAKLIALATDIAGGPSV
jgi:uncharacterized protein (DUF302 family)